MKPLRGDFTVRVHPMTRGMLYLGFAATGVGVALPGVLLPVLLSRWHLRDAQGGRLFLMAWVGSSMGALLVRGSLRARLALGSAAVAAGASGLPASGSWAAEAWIALYGVGLGLAMTSISLMRQQAAARAGTEMVRLNLLWAVGAFCCPALAAHALRTGEVRGVLGGLAVWFVGLAGWAAMQPEVRMQPAAGADGRAWAVFRRVPAGLIAMTFLITGIEASAGGWLTTYARRGGDSIAAAVATPTCFWAGLLVSRMVWSLGEWRVPQAWAVRGSVGLMAVASILLVARGGGAGMLPAAFGMGLGIGPVYPLLLAWALRFHRGGAIFFLAGVGSACLPWMTGVVSTWNGSLRVGLAVPMAATLAMVGLAVMGPMGRWSGEGESG